MLLKITFVYVFEECFKKFNSTILISGQGRALNLTQGKVESTENIYKYHMQVKATTFNVSSKTQLEESKK